MPKHYFKAIVFCAALLLTLNACTPGFNAVSDKSSIDLSSQSTFSPTKIYKVLPPVGKTYYVSPTGSDANVGSLAAPFKTLNYAVNKTAPGDLLYVRGGVYSEAVKLNVSGTAGNPIQVVAYPGEKPILDGSTPFSSAVGFQKLTAILPALSGNPNWNQLYMATVPTASLPSGEAQLVENDEFMNVAQYPDSTENVFEDSKIFAPITSGDGSLTTLGAPFLAQSTVDFWNGAFSGGKYLTRVAIWSKNANNVVILKPVLSSSGDQITFSALAAALQINVIPANTDKVAILNHPSLLKRAGQFVFYDDGSGKTTIFVWPKTDINTVKIIMNTSAISPQAANKGSFLNIAGLQIKNYGDTTNTRAGGIIFPASYTHQSLQMWNLTIKNILGTAVNIDSSTNDMIAYSSVTEIKQTRGITFSNSTNSTVLGCYLNRVERSAIYFGAVNRAVAVDNTVGVTGVHGNGITAYQGSNNVVFAANHVFSNLIAMTTGDSTDVLMIDNILTGPNFGIAMWGKLQQGEFLVFNNLIHTPGAQAIYISPLNLANALVTDLRNNVASGGLGVTSGIGRSYNRYMAFLWNETASSGWFLSTGEAALTGSMPLTTPFPDLITSKSFLSSISSQTARQGVPLSAAQMTKYNLAAVYSMAGLPLVNGANIGPTN